MKKFHTLIITISLLLLWGCEEKYPVYSSFADNDRRSFPKCLHYAIFDPKDKKALESSFGIADSESCEYRVELIKYHVGNCNNPIVKSTGSDFYGYIRVEIRKGFKIQYKIQSDYKSDKEAAFSRVMMEIKKQRSESL